MLQAPDLTDIAVPDTNFGATSCPIITPNDFCTIFNLVIPKEAAGKTCTLQFLFPECGDTRPYYYHGKGNFDFYGYTGYGGEADETWNTQCVPPASV